MLDKLQITETASIRQVLAAIEGSHHGMIFLKDAEEAITALVTDGDIRRHLLDGAVLDAGIGVCANREFIWADQSSPKELLLKRLDSQIRFIPLLDERRRLVGIISRDSLPVEDESRIYARSRSPVRISFSGGGSDLTHYFCDDLGAVINTTISLYSHAVLRLRDDEKVLVHSRDLNDTLVADSLKEALHAEGRFGLIQALLKTVRPDFGFELYLYSDYPLNSGLGGSAVASAAVLGCFNQFRQDKWDQHELAELAFQAERLCMNISGGWQDQYATVFGGFNFMEFRMAQNIVHPLRLSHDILLELEESLILCDTGIGHQSGEIHLDQKQQMQQEEVKAYVQANVELAYTMRNQLLRGKLLDFGHSLNNAWELKRKFSARISSAHLDGIYAMALSHGAIGGKLLGAGGGGFFLFYVPPFAKHELMIALEDAGLKIRPFRFEQEGLQAWTVRESNNHKERE